MAVCLCHLNVHQVSSLLSIPDPVTVCTVMFSSGIVAERIDLRVFLTLGMIGVSIYARGCQSTLLPNRQWSSCGNAGSSVFCQHSLIGLLCDFPVACWNAIGKAIIYQSTIAPVLLHKN